MHNTYVFTLEGIHTHGNVQRNVSLPAKKQTNIISTFMNIRNKHRDKILQQIRFSLNKEIIKSTSTQPSKRKE